MADPTPLDPASAAMLAADAPPPLPALLGVLLAWFEARHLELMSERGFTDVRRAHNQVMVNLPGGGLRLTDLASAANVSKQAIGELVDDLVTKGYLERVPDPTDGRAKLIMWAERGMAAHEATLEVFAEIEAELAEAVGADELETLRAALLGAVGPLMAP